MQKFYTDATELQAGRLVWLNDTWGDQSRVVNVQAGAGMTRVLTDAGVLFGEALENEENFTFQRSDVVGILNETEASAWITGRLVPALDRDPAPEYAAYLADTDTFHRVEHIWIVNIPRAAEAFTDQPEQDDYDSLYYGMKDHASQAERQEWAVKFGVTPGTLAYRVDRLNEARERLASVIKRDYTGLKNRIDSWTNRETKREITRQYNMLKGQIIGYAQLLPETRRIGVFTDAVADLGISWEDWNKLGERVRNYTQAR